GAEASQRHVGIEHGIEERKELARAQKLLANLVARVEKEQRDCEGADQVHEGRCDGAGTNPAHIFAQEASRGFAELANLKIFHAECLDDTISCGGLLQDLCDVAETELAVLGGAANLAAEFVDRPYDQRKKNACRQRHFPIDDQKNEDE